MFIIPIINLAKETSTYRSFDSKDIFSSPSLTRRDIKSKIKGIVVLFTSLISDEWPRPEEMKMEMITNHREYFFFWIGAFNNAYRRQFH